MVPYKIIKNFYSTISPNGSLLGIDYGQKKIGLSISDTTRRLAFAHEILQNNHDISTFTAIKNIIEIKNIAGIVIGFPLQPNGEEGSSCAQVTNFCNNLAQIVNLPIFLQDERFTTKIVRQNLLASGMKSAKKKFVEDKLAAAGILQTSLDQLYFLSQQDIDKPKEVDIR